MIQVVYFLCSLKNVIAMFALVRSVGNKVYYYLYKQKALIEKSYIYIYKLEITNRVFTKYYWSLGASKHIAPQMVYVTNIRNITIARILPILIHYDDVIMGAIASQITNLTIVYSAVYSGANQRKYQKSASLAFVRGIHRWPVNSPHKWPVTREMFSFDDVILHQSFSPGRLQQCWSVPWRILTTLIKIG